MKITQISFSIFIIGLLLLLIIWNLQKPREIKINEMQNFKDKQIKIKGELISSKKYEDFQVITIQDSTGKTKGIFYSVITLPNEIEITGLVKEYNNELEIEITKIIS